MKRLRDYILLVFVGMVFTCCTATKDVHLVLFADFLSPKNTCDSLVDDFQSSGLVDSIKLVGCPIVVSAIKINIDTPRARNLNVDVERLAVQLYSINKLTNPDELMRQMIETKGGNKIALTEIAELVVTAENYRPDVFLPTPEDFFYNDRRGVKFMLFCESKNRKKLLEFIHTNIPDRLDKEFYGKWEFEIQK